MAGGGYNPQSIGTFHKTMVPHLLSQLRAKKDELLVDIGSGQGHVVIPAVSAGYRNVAAVDISPENFELFSKDYGIRGFICDVERDPLPFADGEVSTCICFHLIEHLSSAHNLLGEIRRVLKRNGALAIVTPDWRKQFKTFWRDPTHVHPYDKQSIARLLKIHEFNDIRVYSWGPRYGLGRMRAFVLLPRLGTIGRDLLATATK